MKRRRKTKDEIYRNMSAIRSKNNRTELALRKALHARGLRYRLHVSALPGRPDIVFPTQRVAIFIDGDYWHARAVRENGMRYAVRRFSPQVRPYWKAKFSRRIALDELATAELTSEGWRVLRYWESDVRNNVDRTVIAIERIVREGVRSGHHA